MLDRDSLLPYTSGMVDHSIGTADRLRMPLLPTAAPVCCCILRECGR